MTVEQAAALYFQNNPTPFSNFLSEEGEDLVQAVLKHEKVERVLDRLNLDRREITSVRIERNRRMGDGLGLRVEVEIPIELNQSFTDGDTLLGLMATVTMEICNPNHPYYAMEIWHIQTCVESSDMEDWPRFNSWEVVLPEPELPEPVFIKPVNCG